MNGLKKYTPHDYQKQAIAKMISQACAGLLLDPGLGKTSISLAALSLLKSKKLIKGALIIAPLRACYNVWPTEVEKWQDFAHMTYTIIHDEDKWDNLWGPQRDLYFMNPEGIQALVEGLQATPVSEWPFDVIVIDESTKFKSAASKRFKALKKILHRFRRRYILTGTPTPNGLLDLWSQIFLLDLGGVLGAYITHYKAMYFYSSGFGGYTFLPREHADEEIAERIAPLVMRMRREDYLKLPPLINTYAWVDLPPDARRIYKELEDHFLAEVGDDILLAPNAATAGMKCRQVLNGAIYTNAEHDWVSVHDAKLDAVKDYVEELSGQPLFLLYEFDHDGQRLEELLKWPRIGKSPKKDAELIKAFNRGLLPGLIAQTSSVSHALNLQAACAHVCFFGLTWNFGDYDQAIQRVWRQGNDALRVIAHHIVIRRSLDEVVIRALNGKEKVQTAFMEHIRRLQNSLLVVK